MFNKVHISKFSYLKMDSRIVISYLIVLQEGSLDSSPSAESCKESREFLIAFLIIFVIIINYLFSHQR